MPSGSKMQERLVVIDSFHNPRAKLWASLLESRGLRRHKQFLLAGRKTVPEALAHHPGRFQALLTPDPSMIAGWGVPAGVTCYTLGRPLFERLDVSGTGFPLLVGDVPEMPTADLTQPPRGLEVVCALGDPSNLGALMRSAAAFGVARLVLLAESAHPFHPQALRAAANAQFELTLMRGPAWRDLKRATGPIFALAGDGRSLAGFVWPPDVRLVLGEEGPGLPADLGLPRLAVPTTGTVESLNATVAASLAMFLHFVHAGKAMSGDGGPARWNA
ncbi:MAG: RNA methyltransferase [Rhodospirillales bacterium]|nr:RNA methyltransferase [Rhodospirillales bacterium]